MLLYYSQGLILFKTILQNPDKKYIISWVVKFSFSSRIRFEGKLLLVLQKKNIGKKTNQEQNKAGEKSFQKESTIKVLSVIRFIQVDL